jgi:hypothetical protein
MPCPYFHPVGQLAWPNAPRLPLGDAYAGRCEADPGFPADPDPATLRDCCNLGYARGKCARFPDANGPDAVRFAVTADQGGYVTIYWVREKGHEPFDHGPLEYSRDTEGFTSGSAGPAVQRQAHAYVASYLRRKSRMRPLS